VWKMASIADGGVPCGCNSSGYQYFIEAVLHLYSDLWEAENC